MGDAVNAWLVLKAIAIWGVILMLAFANAGLREVILVPRFGNVRSLTASGLMLSALIFAVAYLSLPWLGAIRTGNCSRSAWDGLR